MFFGQHQANRTFLAGFLVSALVAVAAVAHAQRAEQTQNEEDNHVFELPAVDVKTTKPNTSNRFSLLPLPGGNPTVGRLRLRPQGSLHAQTDLSVRGSSFSGTGLAIGGLALTNPQTEHFHADLPLPTVLFDSVAVSTGLANQTSGSGHLVGTVNLELAPMSTGGVLELGFSEIDGDRQGGAHPANIPCKPEPSAWTGRLRRPGKYGGWT
ncbi:MAG: hypothetical protein K9N51_10320 [Candidatus Pacebacteria bacterium]|nr:hypothetical protein [Candidatus Paceibacterota bacterium]